MAPHITLYHYNPSLPGAVTVAALFFLVTAYLCYQLVRYRSWFTLPLIIGGILQVVGYVSRSLSHDHSQLLGPYIISSIVILVAPAFFAATIYMILGRVIRLLNATHLSPVRVNLLTKLFVLGDIFSFSVQSVGAQAQTGKDLDKQRFGRILIIAGLILQLLIFGLFIVVAIVFNLRFRRQPHQLTETGLPWQRHLISLYATSGLISMRNIVRTIEYALGTDGYIITHEAFLYVFDAAPMVTVMLMMAFVYAPHLLKQKKAGPAGSEMQRLQNMNDHGDGPARRGGEIV